MIPHKWDKAGHELKNGEKKLVVLLCGILVLIFFRVITLCHGQEKDCQTPSPGTICQSPLLWHIANEENGSDKINQPLICFVAATAITNGCWKFFPINHARILAGSSPQELYEAETKNGCIHVPTYATLYFSVEAKGFHPKPGGADISPNKNHLVRITLDPLTW